MSLAMVGLLVATAIARRSPPGLLPAAGFVLLISKAQIEAEERAMGASFGPEWERCVAATPRWLSLRSFARRMPSA